MKYPLTLLAALHWSMLLLAQQNNSSSFYYYIGERKIPLQLQTDKLIVQFYGQVTDAQRSQLLRDSLLLPFKPEDVVPAPEFTLVNLIKPVSVSQLEQLKKRLEGKNEVRHVGHIFKDASGIVFMIQNKMMVMLKSTADADMLSREAALLKLKEMTRDEFDNRLYHFTVDKDAGIDVLELANKLHKSGKYAFAEPDFVMIGEQTSVNDTYLSSQWWINNSGSTSCTKGADIDLFRAWSISTGSPNIKVAVLDDGVDLFHHDLAGSLSARYCAMGSFCGSGVVGMHTSWRDMHGTPCAGIIAAKTNNNTGVAGIAYNSKVFPVVMAYKTSLQLDSPKLGWTSTASWVAKAISWSWKNGADVVSCSFRTGEANSINAAIDSAYFFGRNGKGTVILASSGNENSPNIKYPASNPRVIAVGATDCTDSRASFSNYGDLLDIAAPGVHVYTVDRQDTFGYSKVGVKDYTFYGGTSAACPVAAGVTALVLSVNPNLTAAAARSILEKSGEKVGGYSYSTNTQKPSGLWSDYLGYGRVNAYWATLMAEASKTNSPAVFIRMDSIGQKCRGDVFEVPVYTYGNFGSGNTFVVELSGPQGQFFGATVIGSATSIPNGYAKITCTIPSGTLAGNNYRIRVRATNPNVVSPGSGTFKISSIYCSMSITHNALEGACSGNKINVTIQANGGHIPYGSILDLYLKNMTNTSLPLIKAEEITYNGTNTFAVTLPSSITATHVYRFIIFDKTNNRWSGLSNSLTPPVYCTYCSPVPDIITKRCGILSDGSGSATTHANTKCRWIISPPGATSITLKYLSTSQLYTYLGNHVRIYQGTTESSPIVATWNGSSTIGPITVNSPSVLVVLTTTTPGQGGFDIEYSATVAGTPTVTASVENFGTVNTKACPGGKVKFQISSTNMPCVTKKFYLELSDPFGSFSTIAAIDSPLLNFVNFDYTYLTWDIPGSISPSPFYRVRFRDTSNTIISNLVNLPIEPICQVCGLNMHKTQPIDTITDGSGTGTYPHGMNCSWKVNVPDAKRIDFKTDFFEVINDLSNGEGDTLWIYEGDTVNPAKLQHVFTLTQTGFNFTINSGKAFFLFKSIFSGPGFSISYKATGIKAPRAPNKVCLVYGVDSFEVFNEIFGNFTAGSFVVELSDASGNFGSPIVIGSTTALHTSVIMCSVKSLSIPASSNYRIRVKHSSGLISESIPIEIESIGTLTPVVSPTHICPTGNAMATVTVSGTYDGLIWPDNSSNSSFETSAPGSYTVSVVKGSCNREVSFDVLSTSPPQITTSTTPAVCNNTTTGTATATVTGNAPFNYLWSDSQTTATATDLWRGIYYVTVTDANGCWDVGSVEVREPEAVTATFTYVRPSAVGASDGSITAHPNGGTPPYTYQWLGGHTGATLSGLSAGMYFITITDDNGCTAVYRPQLFDPINPGPAEIKPITCDSNQLRMGLFDGPPNGYNAIHFTPGENYDGHVIEFSKYPTFTPVLDTAVVMGDSALLLKDVDSLEWGEFYFVRIRSFNSSGFGPYSASCGISITPTLYWVSVDDDNWHNPANWRYDLSLIDGHVPDGCAFDVVVLSGTADLQLSNDVTVGNLTLPSNKRILLNDDLTICNNLNGPSTLPFSSFIGAGHIVFSGGSGHALDGKLVVNTITVDNSSATVVLQPTAEIEVSEALELKRGHFDASTGKLTFLSPNEYQCAILDNFSAGYGGTFSGSIFAQRGYASADAVSLYNQHYFSSPVNSPSFSQFAPLTGADGIAVTPTADCDETMLQYGSNYGNVFEYDESNVVNCYLEAWKVRSSGNAVNGRGYSVVKNGLGVLTLHGAPNLGNYSISGLSNSGWSITTKQGSTYQGGWHLLGNPYLASLDLDYTVNTDFDDNVLVLHTHGTYAGTYQPLSMSGFEVLAPFQGFFARKSVSGGAATFNFSNSNRSMTQTAFHKNGAYQMSLLVQGNGYADITYFNFNPLATN
ncbi:MAG: S8 family serine peptidase, partial [Chitinophagales bacterium]|nr:S8 family serine peptidase [Chitinophagales bacterium]